MAQVILPKESSPNSVDPLANEDQNQTKFDLVGILRRRKWLIVLGLLAGIGLGVLYYMQAPVIYGSSAQVFIQKEVPTITPMAGPNAGVFPEFDFESHEKVIASEFLVQRMIDKAPADGFKNLPTFKGMSENGIKGTILEGLSVTPDRTDPNVYNIAFRGLYAEDCPKVVDLITAEYESYLNERRTEVGEEFRDLVFTALAAVRKQIEDEKKLQDSHREAHPDIVFNSEGLIVNSPMTALTELLSRQRQLETEKRELEADLQQVQTDLAEGRDRSVLLFLLERDSKSRFDSSDPSTPTNTIDSREQQHIMRLFEMQVALDDLLIDLGPGHPDVKSQKSKIDRYIEQWNRMFPTSDLSTDPSEPVDVLKLYVASMQDQLRSVSLKLEAINNEYKQAVAAARDWNKIQEIDQGHVRRRESLQETYTVLNRRLDEITALKTGDGDTKSNSDTETDQKKAYEFQTLFKAGVGKKVEPDAKKVFAIAGMLGFLAGFGLAYLVDIADRTYRSPREITEQMHLPLIGHIPAFTFRADDVLPDSNVEGSIVTHHRPKSKISESYRAVRTAVYFGANQRDHKIIQVTSPTMGDGKSTLAANLAVSIANSGKRVLLIDADLRRPRVHKIFGHNPEFGFASILTGDSDPDEVILESEVENLFILPCGSKPSNPSELLTSPQMPNLLEMLREKFDFIIVDTPPVLAVTDPCVVAPRVDAVLLTFRIRKNVKVSAERAREALTAVGGNVTGIVVNGIGGGSLAGNARYGYGGYGARYYDYHYGSQYGYNYVDGYGYGYYYDEEDEPAAANS